MNPKIEIHSAKVMSPERKQELVRWFKKEFGKIPFQWADPDWYVLALSGSKLVGRVGIIERKILIDGCFLEIAGISGVITDQEKRKSGIGTAMLKGAAAFWGIS